VDETVEAGIGENKAFKFTFLKIKNKNNFPSGTKKIGYEPMMKEHLWC